TDLVIHLILPGAVRLRVFRMTKVMNEERSCGDRKLELLQPVHDRLVHWPFEINTRMTAKEPRVDAFDIRRIGAGLGQQSRIAKCTVLSTMAMCLKDIVP